MGQKTQHYDQVVQKKCILVCIVFSKSEPVTQFNDKLLNQFNNGTGH